MATPASAPTTPGAPVVLVIDDDGEIRYSLARVLGARGYEVRQAASGEEGVRMVKASPPDLVFLDNRMGGMGGVETLQHIKGAQPAVMVVLMTAFGTAQTAIEAMKFGAFDYIMKPFDLEKVLRLTENALRARKDLLQAGKYQPLLNTEDHKEGLIGSSAPMQEVFKVIGQVTASDVTVLITGESGTGKELIARSIYKHSHRASRPFIAVNCAAIAENLIESELFGHEKGSFTGAMAQRIGRFEQCDGGTIFLDEIGDMTLATQTKILRVLQEGEVQRVGGGETLRVDVRVIAATNKDLERMVADKTFREDLYYRLNVMRIRVPPLRERGGDIPQIVDFMLQRLAKTKRTRVSRVSPEALEVLCRHRWPGNVRELENAIYRAAVVAQGDAILAQDLPVELRPAGEASPAPATAPTLEPSAAPEPASAADGAAPAAEAALLAVWEEARRHSPADPLGWIREEAQRLGLLSEPDASTASTAAAGKPKPEPPRPRPVKPKGGKGG